MSARISDFTSDKLYDLFSQAKDELNEIEAKLDKVREKGHEVGWLEGTPVKGWSAGETIGIWFLGYFGFSCAIMFTLMLIAALSNNLDNFNFLFVGASPFLGMIISTIFVVLRRKAVKTKNTKTYQEKLSVLKKELDTLVEETDNFIEKRADKALLVPTTYRYLLAVETMQGYITDQTADTWRECAEKYEKQLDRWIQEQNSQKALELQEQILRTTESARRSAKAAAIFSGISAFGKVSSALSDW